MSGAVDVFSILGSVANIVMAGAAVGAITLWRDQVAGASSHALARKVAAALRHDAINRSTMLSALRHLEEDPRPEAKAYIKQKFVEPAQPKLYDSAMELLALEGEVEVQWGKTAQGLIETIRGMSAQLATHLVFLESDDDGPEVSVARELLAKPRIAPTYTGPTYRRAAELLTELTQQFLAGHIGREGAALMSTDELTARRRQVDDEIARLAETERAAIARGSQT